MAEFIFLVFFICIVNILLWIILNGQNKNKIEENSSVTRYSKKKRIFLFIPPCSYLYIIYLFFYHFFKGIIDEVKSAWED